MHSMIDRAGFQGMQSLWRDARVEPLDGLTGTDNNYPVDDYCMILSVSRAPVCRGRTDLARGSKGAKPTGKFSESGKAQRLLRCSGALWLATMRNLPNHPEPIWKLRRSAAGDLWSCDLPGKKMTDDGMKSECSSRL